ESVALGLLPGGNIALSDDQQQYIQAKEDIITAVLRKESGALISDEEFAKEDKKLFPQFGDKAGVLKQKSTSRQRAFESLRAQSKGVFDVQFGKKAGTPSKPAQEFTSPGGIKFTVK
ncbi:hypothetical protein IID10_15170, partial [candidate division KSB1 bacterium]|nr:hypothetical protein [candidate division KSB1 bacterium]